ncbi:hypothetical protein ACJMK2_026036 [Sinanodonta woodiana]|uniref:Ig-like domain-containing protein n=1 Tax=Sinanodonta woodiana TaxID=1069815 RepID=A0ABD3XIT1_SINWO
MKMGLMCVVIICISVDFIFGKARGRENEIVAITGCNATLEWIIATTYWEAYAHWITVINANGHAIAEKKDMTCKDVTDSSTYCEIRNTSNTEWRFIVVLSNVTQPMSGNYTGQIKYGPRNEINSTKRLIVLDKPHIKESRTPILHEQLNILCSVDGELQDPVYYWKLNGTYLNSTDRIRADHFILIFERVTLEDKFTLFSCIICSSINCCTESDAYVPDPYCTCTEESSLGNSKDIRYKEYWIGTLIVSVFLLIVGSLLYVKQWRKSLTRETDSNILSDAEVNRWHCSMGVTTKRKRLLKPLSTVNMENKTFNENYNTCPQPQDINNPQQEKAELILQDYMNRKRDQTALSFYDYATCTVSEGNTHATESSTKDSHYDYVSSIAMSLVEKADVHVTDENYITPVNVPDCPIDQCQCENGVTDITESDQTYITPTSDPACPIEISHDAYTTIISE